MSWWPKPKKSAAAAEEALDGHPPRSTLLPPPPPGMEEAESPRTMRVPAAPDVTLALVDAAMAEDDDIDYEDFGFDDEVDDDDSRPTPQRSVFRPASPTLRSRVA